MNARSILVVALGFAALACGGGAGDSTGTSSGAATGCAPAGPTSTVSRPVSFQTDVMPIFRQSCAFSSCHGDEGADHGVFLGADPTKVRASLLGPATEAPSVPHVAPGDPGSSYLVHKLDGDLCAVATACNGGDCQGTMPKDSPLLSPASRDLVRTWVAQGAGAN